MPRPMVPAPATPAVRSLRETSSMEGPLLYGGVARYNRRGGGGMRTVARTAATAAAIALAVCAATALGEPFPAKPLTLICPWPAGGTTDTHLRKFAEVAQKYLGQPVVIENKPGGG